MLNNSTFTSNFLIPTIVTALGLASFHFKCHRTKLLKYISFFLLGEVPRVDVTTAINEGSTFFAAPEVGTDSYSAMSTAIADVNTPTDYLQLSNILLVAFNYFSLWAPLL